MAANHEDVHDLNRGIQKSVQLNKKRTQADLGQGRLYEMRQSGLTNRKTASKSKQGADSQNALASAS